jgi:hypothetical protein
VVAPRVGEALEAIGDAPWAIETSIFGTRVHVVVEDADEGRRQVEALLAAEGNDATSVARILPTLEDVFIHHVERAEAERATVDAGGVA